MCADSPNPRDPGSYPAQAAFGYHPGRAAAATSRTGRAGAWCGAPARRAC